MRFRAEGPAIPDTLLERRDAGRVVFLCGAGVSLPSGMPSFVDLTQYVIEFFDPPADSEIMAAFRPWQKRSSAGNVPLDQMSAGNVPLDQIFNLLHLEYGKDEVNALVTKRLRASPEREKVGHQHDLIKRISSNQSGAPQVVTTNFDRLFETGRDAERLAWHVPPAFPELTFGSSLEGITYLHGRLVETTAETHPYVLSSADFGRAYLSEGWATNFIRHLLERYTVVLVGYKAEDPPVKYLLQGLNHDGQYDRSRLYAFDRGQPEEIEAKWRDRGVTALAYSDHGVLWETLEAWAERADDPRRWRESVIAQSQRDPKQLAPHERGQVAHVLRTVQGAKAFSEADPLPHPEWICVMDASVRSGKPSESYGRYSETFDPVAAYGLDDDLEDISESDHGEGVGNDDLLVWRSEDDNPPESHQFSGLLAEGSVVIPPRLEYLMTWAGKSIDSPVLAWWAIQQSGLHPRLLKEFEWQLRHSKTLNERARHIWRLIVECQPDPRNLRWNGAWFDFKHRINTEGWTAGVLREFRRVATPRLVITSPSELGRSWPPQVPWEALRFDDLGQFGIVFLEHHSDNINVPDDRLPQVIGILEAQMIAAAGLLLDAIRPSFFCLRTPTCYPGRDTNVNAFPSAEARAMTWFIQLFDRLAVKWPALANAHATTWPDDRFFFRKLKLYAFSKVDAFEADPVAEAVLSLGQEVFWDTAVIRELLFLLVDRWNTFSEENRKRLIDRILTGPDQFSYWSDDEFPRLRDELAARYARYLELQGCELTADRHQRLTEMMGTMPQWSDTWASSMVIERGSRIATIATDEAPDAILNLPANEVIPRAKEDLKRDFGSFTERRPFTGLVKADPRKALLALKLSARAGDHPGEFWAAMLERFPADAPPRLRRVFLSRVARLPHAVVLELRHILCHWLQQNLAAILEFDEDLGWAVYDHVVDGVLSGGAAAANSALGEISQGGKVIQRSRRTWNHAFDAPIGMCTDALLHAVSGENQEAGSLVPDHIKSRIERLLAAPGEDSDHAVSILCGELSRLMLIDPAWVEKTLVPMLSFEHLAAEPAWSGLLGEVQLPRPPLREIVIQLLPGLFPWLGRLSWDPTPLEIAAQWLGTLRMFPPNESSRLSSRDMRSALRAMPEDIRNDFIFWLSRIGRERENNWVNHIVPLIDRDWPRERRYRTSASVRAWVALLRETGDSFPSAYEAVKKFLAPVETSRQSFFWLSEERPITARFPEQTLDLMHRTTPQMPTDRPSELSKVLAIIAETAPTLMSDPRYLRLIDLLERS